jgi:hypothetical protein
MGYIEKLKKEIRDLHGCESRHTASIAVNETFESTTVWPGAVEVFSLVNHPTATTAYAWSYQKDGKMRYVAVLEVPPVSSAHDAVRAVRRPVRQVHRTAAGKRNLERETGEV